MDYFKEPSKEACYTTWNPKVGDDGLVLFESKQRIFDFMNRLCSINQSKRMHWYSPGDIKHMAEDWLRTTGQHSYVCRDLCTALAIALGQPVDLYKNTRYNKIGLYISPAKFRNLYMNVRNFKAVSLVDAMQDPNKFRFSVRMKQ